MTPNHATLAWWGTNAIAIGCGTEARRSGDIAHSRARFVNSKKNIIYFNPISSFPDAGRGGCALPFEIACGRSGSAKFALNPRGVACN